MRHYPICLKLVLRLGLFVLGTCPGGTGSNFWTLLLNGDINLSITMTFVSTVAALGMMPLWIFLMAPLLTEVLPKDVHLFFLNTDVVVLLSFISRGFQEQPIAKIKTLIPNKGSTGDTFWPANLL